jgi:hypothetical protein
VTILKNQLGHYNRHTGGQRPKSPVSSVFYSSLGSTPDFLYHLPNLAMTAC